MLGTIRAVEQDLMSDGLLLRYRTQSGVDGLSGREHPFVACSFWLVEAYAMAGRLDDAHALMRRLLALANDVGLLARSTTLRTGRFAGNFPQAFSHLTLVGAAMALRDAERDVGDDGRNAAVVPGQGRRLSPWERPGAAGIGVERALGVEVEAVPHRPVHRRPAPFNAILREAEPMLDLIVLTLRNAARRSPGC